MKKLLFIFLLCASSAFAQGQVGGSLLNFSAGYTTTFITTGTTTLTLPTSGTLITSASLIGIAQGGTGATSLTNHGVVIGQGSSAVTVTSAGTSGQVLTSNGASADPTFQSHIIGIQSCASAGNANYLGIFSGSGSSSDLNDVTGSGISKVFIASTDCTLSNLTVQIVTSATACNLTYTIHKNASDASPTVTVTNTTGYGTDNSNTVSLSQGDRVCLHFVTNSGSYFGNVVYSFTLSKP